MKYVVLFIASLLTLGLAQPDPASADLACLFQSIQESDAASFASALAAGADVNGMNQDGQTPLMLAVRLDQAEFVDALIEIGADVHATTREWGETDDWTALHYAARNQASERIVASLLQAGANPNAATPTMVVRINGVESTSGGVTPLMLAAMWGSLETVDALIAAGADVNAARIDGFTPLHYAAMGRSREHVVASLLHAGADPTRANQDGALPVDFAFPTRNSVAAELLREAATQPASVTGTQGGSDLERVRERYDEYAAIVAQPATSPASCITVLRTLPDSVRRYGDFALAAGMEYVYMGSGPDTVETNNTILALSLANNGAQEVVVETYGLHLAETIGAFHTTVGAIPQYSVYVGHDDQPWLTMLIANGIVPQLGHTQMCLGIALGPRP